MLNPSRAGADDDQATDSPAGQHPSPVSIGRVYGAPRLSRLTVPKATALHKLDEAATTPLCVVHAPAGYGKTTLLARWAPRRARSDDGGHVFWLTIDQSCDTRYAFWQSLFELIAESGVTGILHSPPMRPAGDISASFPALLRRAWRGLRQRTIVILDAWENVKDPAIGSDILAVLRHAHDVSFIVSTRSLQGPMLDEVREHDAPTLGADDLALTTAEFAAMAVRSEITLTHDEITYLVAATGGWPFALRAVLEASRDHLHFELNGTETLTALGSRLADQVVALPGCEYIITASVAESFTPELARWLGADPSDEAVLQEIEARGLGTWDTGASPAFRIQPLLRDALRSRLSPHARREAHRRLALWHERNGQLTRAFFAALDAHDSSLAVGYAQRAFVPITVALHRDPDALTSQRRAFFLQQPLLSLLNGIAHNILGHTRQAVHQFLATIALSESQLVGRHSHPTPNQVWVQGALTAGLRLVGRYELVGPAYRRFRRMLAHVHDPDGVLDTADSLFTAESAVTLIYLDQLDDASNLLQQGPAAPSDESMRQAYYQPSLAALVDAARGRITDSIERVESLQRAGLPRQFDHSFYAVPLHLATAHAALEEFRFDDAAAAVELCMPHWKTIEMWPLLLEAEARAMWQKHDADAGLALIEERLAEKRKNPPISPAMSALLDALRADMHLSAGALEDAHALAPARRYRNQPRLAVPRALAFLLGGRPERALDVVEDVVDSPRLLRRQRVELELIAASALLRRDDPLGARSRFESAAGLALDQGLRLPFARMPHADALELAQTSRYENEVVRILKDLPVRFAEPDAVAGLTRREEIVLARLATGDTLAEIARALSVSPNTVKSQARAVYRKLAAPGRSEAVAEARRRGIL